MRPPRPLPFEARIAPFASGAAASLGLSRERLRRRDIAHPFRGVSSSADAAERLLDRCHEFGPLLRPGQAFSHVTALELWGAPVPPSDSALHVSVLFPRTPPRGSGIRGHALARMDVRLRDALPVSSPAAAWLESASCLPMEELVACGDFLVSGSPALTTVDDLVAVTARDGVPGLRRARRALPLIRRGPRSRPESLLRLLVVAAGIPEPEIEHPIPVTGGMVFHGDLVFVDERVVLEYEGDGHRVDRRTWQRDLRRRELMEAASFRVVRVTSHDVFVDPGEFVARLRGILHARRFEVRASASE